MATPITLVRAFAPLAAAAVSIGVSFTVAGVICLASAALLWTLRRRRDRVH
jgi:LPXTG-motif cell wall-anchored protein